MPNLAPEAPSVLNTDEDWRVVRGLNLYRWVLAVGLFALAQSNVLTRLLDIMWPALFNATWLTYLLLCIFTSYAAHRRAPALWIQAYLLVGIDIAFVVGLVLSGAGVQSGLGMLLIAPIAGASILVPPRMAALLAAIASLSLLAEEVWRQLLYVGETPGFVQAGILGVLLFISAIVANSLAMRARRSAALAASRKSELDDMAALNERIIQRIQIGLIALDENGRIRMLNRSARQMLGLQPTSIGDALSSVAPTLASALLAWEASPQLLVEPFSTGKYSLLPRFTRLGHGPSTPVLVFLEDAQRVSEQAQKMKLAALGHLTANIAHEIRNPLSAISHANQLLNESTHLDNDDHRMLAIMKRHTKRIDHIVQSVLGLSRRNAAEPERIHLREWIHNAIKDYSHGRQDAPHFVVDGLSSELEVRIDPNHLRQILYNLWENAEAHARVPERELVVTLRAGLTDDACFLDIADNGPGLGGHQFAQLLEPFFTTSNEGTGLGLYIVRDLCECNYAHIDLAPRGESSIGTTLRISFAPPERWDAILLPAVARA